MKRARDEIAQRLDGLRSRGEVKAFAAEVARDPALRAAVLAVARKRGVIVADDEDPRRLVKAALDREAEARVRLNPVHRDGGFECAFCGHEVSPGGRHVRDHCPRCLRGLHVDVVPGDRAAGCGGILDPTGFVLRGRAGAVIQYRCRRCGYGWQGRAHADDKLPAALPGHIPHPKTWLPEDFGVTIEGAATSVEVAGPGEPALPVARARTLPMRVLDAVRRQRLWEPGADVLLAVSGGCDSTALLHLLARTARAHGGRLRVASVDHGLRPESVAEVAAVGRDAAGLGLPFSAVTLDIATGPNLAARARGARRSALIALGADRVATAHHQDDQAETVLYHLLRGSGAAGLAGMRSLDPPWCRPLLAEPRAVIEAWARLEGLRWVEDPSNETSQRGALRRLMPALDEVHGGACAALARSARLIARDDALLEAFTDEAWARAAVEGGVDWRALVAEPDALQLRLLRRLTAPCPGPVRADQLEAALGWEPGEGARLPLPGGWSLVVRGGVVRLSAPEMADEAGFDLSTDE